MALSADVMEKTRVQTEQTLISNLYLCLGERGKNELHNQRPSINLATTRYHRLSNIFEEIINMERNETFKTYQLLLRKHCDSETLAQCHSVLSEVVARCYLRTLESRILTAVFIVKMRKKERQMKLCRSNKTSDEVYSIALSNERGDKYTKIYKLFGGAIATTPAGALQIKIEPISATRGDTDGHTNGKAEERGATSTKLGGRQFRFRIGFRASTVSVRC